MLVFVLSASMSVQRTFHIAESVYVSLIFFYCLDGLHHKVTVFQRMLDHTHKLRLASLSLEELFDKYAPTPDLNCK